MFDVMQLQTTLVTAFTLISKSSDQHHLDFNTNNVKQRLQNNNLYC